MIECIKEHIEFIKLWFYIIQIVIISYWIFIWYKNYNELLRKNKIDESPYLSAELEGQTLLLKNHWKTAIIITNISLIKGDNINNLSTVELKENNLYEIMPSEKKIIDISMITKIIKISLDGTNTEDFDYIRVKYKNSIAEKQVDIQNQKIEFNLVIW